MVALTQWFWYSPKVVTRVKFSMTFGPSAPNQMATGYAGSRSADLAAEANQLMYTTAWCRETRPRWEAKVCRLCAQDLGASPAGAVEHCTQLCRQHLADDAVTLEGSQAVASELRDIAVRLRHLAQSMTKDGTPASAKDDSSWIEALGWFAGWNRPLTLASPPIRSLNPATCPAGRSRACRRWSWPVWRGIGASGVYRGRPSEQLSED